MRGTRTSVILYCMVTKRIRIYLLLATLLTSLPSNAQRYNGLYPVLKYVKIDERTSLYKLGFVNASGKLVIDYKYNDGAEVPRFIDGMAIVEKDGWKGGIDTADRVTVPFIYRSLFRIVNDPSVWVGKTTNDSMRIFDTTGHIYYNGLGDLLVMKELNRISIWYSGRKTTPFVILMDDKFNKLAEFSSKEDIQIMPYDQLQTGSKKPYNTKGLRMGRGQSGAVLDIRGRLLFDSVAGYAFNQGEMELYGKNRGAVIDTDLKEVIPFSLGFTKVQCMHGTGYYYVYKDSLSGVIDDKLKMIVDLKIKNETITECTSSWFETANDKTGVYSYYNYKGEKLIESKKRVFAYADTRYPMVVKKDENAYQLWAVLALEAWADRWATAAAL